MTASTIPVEVGAASVIVCVVPPLMYMVDKPPVNEAVAVSPPDMESLVVNPTAADVVLADIELKVYGMEEPSLDIHPYVGRLVVLMVEHD